MKRLLALWFMVILSWSSAASAGEPLKIGVAAMISPKETVKFYKQMLNYVGRKIGRPVEIVQKQNYDEMDALLEQGEISIAFICSGPYVRDHDLFGVELLVAPQSYGRPFYYAYVIVHKDSAIKSLSGLKGKSFAFTDPKSNTGRLVPAYMIAQEARTTPEKFFGEVIYTYSHDRSVEAVAKKLADGASVDSLVYDYAAKKSPGYTSQTKIIRTSPPYGIPPVVVRTDMDPALRDRLRDIFLNMHKDPAGKAILDGIMVDRFIVPKDSDYDTVRMMADWIEMAQ